MESRNFFCLTSYPGDISQSDSANRELSNDVLAVVVRRLKIALHTSSHLTPTEAWRSAVSTCPQYSDHVCTSCSYVLHFWMLLFFSNTSYPAEMAYFNSPNRELSNGVQVMELYCNRNVYPSRSPCLETVDRKTFEHRNFLVLRPVLLKIAYFNSANRQLSIDVRPNELR